MPCGRQRYEICTQHVGQPEGEGHHRGKEENPFEERDHRITLYHRAENAEIHGEENAVANHKEQPLQIVSVVGATVADSREDKVYDAEKTHGHSRRLFPCDRFPDGYCGDKHCVDWHERAHQRTFHRRYQGYRRQKSDLGEKEPEQRGQKNHDIIPARHLLAGEKEGQNPENSPRPRRTQLEDA